MEDVRASNSVGKLLEPVAIYFLFNFVGILERCGKSPFHAWIWRSVSLQPSFEEVAVSPVSCLIFQAISDWHLGEISSCKASVVEAILPSNKLTHMHTLAVAFGFAGLLAHVRHDPCKRNV
jgi:hypothetical protein